MLSCPIQKTTGLFLNRGFISIHKKYLIFHPVRNVVAIEDDCRILILRPKTPDIFFNFFFFFSRKLKWDHAQLNRV